MWYTHTRLERVLSGGGPKLQTAHVLTLTTMPALRGVPAYVREAKLKEKKIKQHGIDPIASGGVVLLYWNT